EANLDAKLADQFHFGEGKRRRYLVGGNAEGVEATGHVACLEDDDVVATFAQFVGARQASGAGADDRDLLAGRRARPEEAGAAGGRAVRGVALQPADRDRRPQPGVLDARPLAQHLGWAGAGTAAAEDVRLQDRARGAAVVLVQDLADEPGHVDVRR